MAEEVLVIGIGNTSRSDDGIGKEVARRLQSQVGAEVEVKQLSGETSELLEAWGGREKVIAVDAMHSGKPAGTVLRILANEKEIPATYLQCSTHGFGLREAVELGRSLDQLPEELIIYAVEGSSFEDGEQLSSEAERGVEKTVRLILEEL